MAADPVRPPVRRHRLLRRVHHLLHHGGRGGPAAANTAGSGWPPLYLAVSLVAGLLAAAVGIGLARWDCSRAVRDEPIPDPDDLGLLDQIGRPTRPSPAGDRRDHGDGR